MAHLAEDNDPEGAPTAASTPTDGPISANVSDKSWRTSDDPGVVKVSHRNTEASVSQATNGEDGAMVQEEGDDKKKSDDEWKGENEMEIDDEKKNGDEKKSDGENKNNDEKDRAGEKSEPSPPPTLPRTRIGRPNKDDRKDIIDQADWQTMVPKKDPESKFVMAVKEGDDGKEQVILYSAYIQKVFRAVIRYIWRVVWTD
jgi:hypothetical protein